jgi:hypothetical protein
VLASARGRRRWARGRRCDRGETAWRLAVQGRRRGRCRPCRHRRARRAAASRASVGQRRDPQDHTSHVVGRDLSDGRRRRATSRFVRPLPVRARRPCVERPPVRSFFAYAAEPTETSAIDPVIVRDAKAVAQRLMTGLRGSRLTATTGSRCVRRTGRGATSSWALPSTAWHVSAWAYAEPVFAAVHPHPGATGAGRGPDRRQEGRCRADPGAPALAGPAFSLFVAGDGWRGAGPWGCGRWAACTRARPGHSRGATWRRRAGWGSVRR